MTLAESDKLARAFAAEMGLEATDEAQNRSPSLARNREFSPAGSQVRTANVSYEIPEGQRRVIVNLDTLE